MDYTGFVTQLANTLVVPADDPRLVALLPGIISDATMRIVREPGLDFLATRGGPPDTSQFTTKASRIVPFPPSILVLEQANLILPENQTNPALGQRVSLLRTSQPLMDLTWPIESQTAPPKEWETYYTINSQLSDATNQILISPTPDGTYTLEAFGTRFPTPLSAATPENFLSIYYYDLFFCAAMVFASGAYLKNWGAAGAVDDAGMGVTWEAHYQQLMHGVSVESMRQKYTSSGWSPYPPAPLAPMPRHERMNIPQQPAQPPG